MKELEVMDNYEAVTKNSDLKIYDPLISNVDINHLRVCPCYKPEVDERFNLLWEDEEENIKEDTPDYVIHSLKKNTYNEALQQIAAELPLGTKCPLEKSAISSSIAMFSNSHYDLTNPVVFNIVKNALNIELNTFRLQLMSNTSDLVSKTVKEDGSVSWILNPSVEASRKSSETIIKAMEILSRIVDGNLQKNLNISVDLEVIKFDDLFGDDK